MTARRLPGFEQGSRTMFLELLETNAGGVPPWRVHGVELCAAGCWPSTRAVHPKPTALLRAIPPSGNWDVCRVEKPSEVNLVWVATQSPDLLWLQ